MSTFIYYEEIFSTVRQILTHMQMSQSIFYLKTDILVVLYTYEYKNVLSITFKCHLK